MRNLVDVQRKVERRHRRDRERQMLRVRGEGVMFWSFPLTAQPHLQVQERLTIVQSRKAEEDLLGRRRADGLTRNLPQVTRFARTPEEDGGWTRPLKHLFSGGQVPTAVRRQRARGAAEKRALVCGAVQTGQVTRTLASTTRLTTAVKLFLFFFSVRNTAGFKELLGPEALRGSETDDGTKGAAAHLHDSLKLF